MYALLVRLLQQHPQHDALLTAAGGFVATVCVTFSNDWESSWPSFQTPIPETQRVFLAGGTVEYVLAAMRRRPEEKGTLIMGFIALSALAWQNEEGAAKLLASLELLDRLLVRERKERERAEATGVGSRFSVHHAFKFTPPTLQAGVASQRPDACFFGLMALGAIVSFPRIDLHPDALQRCRYE